MNQHMNFVPFSMNIQRDQNGRIFAKTEHVAGGLTRELRYQYTRGGLLQIVELNGSRVETYDYDNQDRRSHSQTSDPMLRERFLPISGRPLRG